MFEVPIFLQLDDEKLSQLIGDKAIHERSSCRDVLETCPWIEGRFWKPLLVMRWSALMPPIVLCFSPTFLSSGINRDCPNPDVAIMLLIEASEFRN